VEIDAINFAANTITLRRKMTAEDGGYGTNVAPAYPAGFTIGRGPEGSWNRPFAAFPAGQNGKPTADIGIANGTVTRARTWDPTRNGTGHLNFREGYFGHRSYWDPSVGPAAYQNWTPQDGGGTRSNAWDGDEFWLQFRAKISLSRFSAPRAKMLFIQQANLSGASQLFWGVGGQSAKGEQMPPAERVTGVTYGGYPLLQTCYGDSRAPAGGILQPQGNTTFDTSTPLFSDYPNSIWQQGPSNFLSWCYPADKWVTYLIHMKMGKDNAPAAPNNPNAEPTAPFPSAADPTYRTLFELYVCDEGGSAYKALIRNSVPTYTWFFGDQGNYGWYYYNPPALNTLWMSQNLNDYVGAGSVSPPSVPHQIEYTQAILSKNFIPVPLA
jgi:hypothetical protein